MSTPDSPRLSEQYFEGDEIPEEELQYLQYNLQTSQDGNQDNAMNEISVIKAVGTWEKASDLLKNVEKDSFQSGKVTLHYCSISCVVLMI